MKKIENLTDLPLKPQNSYKLKIKEIREKYDLLQDQIDDLQELKTPMERIYARDKILPYIYPKLRQVEVTSDGENQGVVYIIPPKEAKELIEKAKKNKGSND